MKFSKTLFHELLCLRLCNFARYLLALNKQEVSSQKLGRFYKIIFWLFTWLVRGISFLFKKVRNEKELRDLLCGISKCSFEYWFYKISAKHRIDQNNILVKEYCQVIVPNLNVLDLQPWFSICLWNSEVEQSLSIFFFTIDSQDCSLLVFISRVGLARLDVAKDQ